MILVRDKLELMLQSRASLAKDVAPIREALGKMPLVVLERTTFYGARELIVHDPAGNVVFFASHER